MRNTFGKMMVVILINVLISCSAGDYDTANELESGTFLGTTRTLIDAGQRIGDTMLRSPNYARVNPLNNNEIYISDTGANRVLVFNKTGDLLRTIGKEGFGPGELLGPMQIDIDVDGNLYVYENRNDRISIFSSDGEFKKHFRGSVRYNSSFSAVNEDKILLNQPYTGYYITVTNSDNDFFRGIGEISEIRTNSDGSRNFEHAEGFPVYDSKNDRYCIFLTWSGLVKVYNENGELEQEVEPHFSPTYKEFVESERAIRSKREKGYYSALLFFDVTYNNGNYVLSQYGRDKEYYLGIYVLTDDFKLRQSIFIPMENDYSRAIAFGMRTRQFGISLEEKFVIIPGDVTGKVLISNYEESNGSITENK